MIFYTSLQSAPCFIEDKPVLIPLGVDQDPHFRLTRDIAQKIGKPKPALIHNIMIPGLKDLEEKCQHLMRMEQFTQLIHLML